MKGTAKDGDGFCQKVFILRCLKLMQAFLVARIDTGTDLQISMPGA